MAGGNVDVCWRGAAWRGSSASRRWRRRAMVAAFEGHWRRSARIQVGIRHARRHVGGRAAAARASTRWSCPGSGPDGGWPAAGHGRGRVGRRSTRGGTAGATAGVREHMWPSRPTGRWRSDLSWAGWCHVVYVAVELALLAAYVISAMPPPAVAAAVALLLTAHVPSACCCRRGRQRDRCSAWTSGRLPRPSRWFGSSRC